MLEHRPLLEPTENPQHLSTDRMIPEINLIPFIDVLLVILIFLMISTTFTQYQQLSIALPTANGSAEQMGNKDIRVAISKDGRFAINGTVVEAARLSTTFSELLAAWNSTADEETISKNVRVIISADAKASHQDVMRILEIAGQSHIGNIAFATQESSAAPRSNSQK